MTRLPLRCIASPCLLLGLMGCADDDANQPPPAADAAVRINELSSSALDSIELYNSGEQMADLSGWLLTDDIDPGVNASLYDPESKEGEMVFAAGTTLQPGAYLVIHRGQGVGMHPFGLSAGGDTVSLLNDAMQLVDQVSYAAGKAEISYCLLDGGWDRCAATFGAVNRAALCGNGTLDEGERCDASAAVRPCSDIDGLSGGDLGCSLDCSQEDLTQCVRNNPARCDAAVRLNEVCHKASKCGVDGQTQGDWIELHNTSDQEADASGCSIRVVNQDGTARLGPRQIGLTRAYVNATLPAGGFLLIDNDENLVNIANDNTVELLDQDAQRRNHLISSSAFNDAGDACSIDEAGDHPTPGAANHCSDP